MTKPIREPNKDYRLKKTENLTCPYCGLYPDYPAYPAGDFVILGKTGANSASDTQCGECDKYFRAQLVDEDTILVQRV